MVGNVYKTFSVAEDHLAFVYLSTCPFPCMGRVANPPSSGGGCGVPATPVAPSCDGSVGTSGLPSIMTAVAPLLAPTGT
jgi:hypothetical protein